MTEFLFYQEMSYYDHKKIEQKWREYWLTNKTFKANDFADKPSFYALDMFPYPSGAGLHVGHPLGYTATDIICRKKRQQGYEVLHPIGWDAFGLPAENYALKTGTHPAITTETNIKTFKRQIQALGFSYDWDREITTTDTDYYKWTQWIFLQLYNKDLAYEKKMSMAWCPKCKIVVANEEVEQGTHERCGATVERRSLKQWMFKITEYAQRLLDDLDDLPEWPEKIKSMQRHWIGRSEGAEVDFEINGEKIRVFTTRPDTLFGATYFVLAPEHTLVDKITIPEQKDEIVKYKKQCSSKSDLERTELNKDKTGVFTGAFAINPVNGKKIPVWIADYVMMSYGTGAIMAVPAHDDRDFEFATKFGLEIVQVVENNEQKDDSLCKEGIAINSEFLDGLTTEKAKQKMIEYLEEKGIGERKVNFKLRDWIFTRQRYWGEPIPLVHSEDGKVYPLDETELPLQLPKVDKYELSSTGESPIANIRDWVEVKGWITEKGTVKILGKGQTTENKLQNFTRETSTMPNWAGSSWYWLRYMDPKNDKEFCSKEIEKYWGPVDLYIGGTEHAVLHLLYARFWHKVLYDLGLVNTKEPFKKLVNQGLIMGEDGNKMSKSLGNVINPDEIIEEVGADTLRMYEMFMGPFDQSKTWNAGAVGGVRRFLDRVWRLYEKEIKEEPISKELNSLLHKTIKIVTEHIDTFKFNTAISQMMVLVNELTGLKFLPKEIAEKFIILLSPFAPHMTEEIWDTVLGNKKTLAYEKWPEFDETLIQESVVVYAVQINGKVRADFQIEKDTSKEDVIAYAKSIEKIQKYLEEGEIRKEIFVPGKIVGFVVK